MTLAEQRAAIAANMAASRAPTSAASRAATQASMAASRAGDGGAARRASGAANAAARQASGAANAAERRGTSLVENLQTLQAPPVRRATPLPSVPPAGGVPAQTGRGEYKAPATKSGGIASPLVEVPDTRTYHPYRVITTVDGMLSLGLRRVASISMTDANDEPVRLEFADVT